MVWGGGEVGGGAGMPAPSRTGGGLGNCRERVTLDLGSEGGYLRGLGVVSGDAKLWKG